MAPTIRATVGRDALILPDLRRSEHPRADMESAPTNGGEARSNRETAVTAAMETPCRGRFNIGPVCGGANVRGRDQSRPYE